MVLGAVFESQQHTASPVPTTIVTALKTPSETGGFMKFHQKLEKSPISPKIASESLVSGYSKWMDDTSSPPAPTSIITVLKIHSELPSFAETVEKSAISNKKHPKTPISELFNWVYNTKSLPTPFISPTKHPCDLSHLYSCFVLIFFVISQHFYSIFSH